MTKNENKICNEIKKYIVKGKILDIGGADSNLDKILKKDYSIMCVDTLDSKNTDLFHDCNKPLPFEDNSIDTIISCNLIEHLENPLNFLKECRRIIKEDGKIIIITPNAHGLQELGVAFGLKYPCSEDNGETYVHHIYNWAKYNFDLIVKESRLQTIQFKYLSYFWHKNIIFKFIAWIIPVFRPYLFYVLKK